MKPIETVTPQASEDVKRLLRFLLAQNLFIHAEGGILFDDYIPLDMFSAACAAVGLPCKMYEPSPNPHHEMIVETTR